MCCPLFAPQIKGGANNYNTTLTKTIHMKYGWMVPLPFPPGTLTEKKSVTQLPRMRILKG